MYEPSERGEGKALCHICGQPCRDHRIGPCPESGVTLFKKAFGSETDVTDRTLWRRGEKPPPKENGIRKVKVHSSWVPR